MSTPRFETVSLSPEPGEQAALAAYARWQTEKARQREEAVRRQRLRGSLSADERIRALLDAGSFTELGSHAVHRSAAPGLAERHPPGDAVVTGHGTVNGRLVCCFAQDFSVFGGSLGEVVGEKIVRLMDLAMDAAAPVIGINDSAGGRIQEGPVAQSLYGQIFARNVHMSGAVPQISLITGPSAGGAAYSPALTDFVVMVDGLSQMFVTGPEVTRQSIGEVVTLEELGGARMHSVRAGTAHYLAATEADAFAWTRALIGYLPPVGERLPGLRPPEAAAATTAEYPAQVLPPAGKLRDARHALAALLDDGDSLEVQAGFAPSVIVAFGRLNGCSVGAVATQPLVDGGALTAAACDKVARFVRTCDAYGLPVLSLVDSPASVRGGVLPGVDRSGARLLHAYAEATVPLLTVTTGESAGLSHVALGSRRIGGDLHLAWPAARIDGHDIWTAAGDGVVDEVLLPQETRLHLLRTLWLLRDKRPHRPPKKHDNLPL